jgi:hypothetical protein
MGESEWNQDREKPTQTNKGSELCSFKGDDNSDGEMEFLWAGFRLNLLATLTVTRTEILE